MKKKQRLIYWIATIWLALGMTSTGIVQIIQLKDEADNFINLGYPSYLMHILGIWKLLGVIALLIPKTPILKEWAYAGFFFTMSGALLSHIIIQDEPTSFFGPILLLILIALSWYSRPSSRKTAPHG